MQLSHLLGASVLLAGLGLVFAARGDGAVPTPPPQQPAANGHFVLVVDGDRDQLGITAANHKQDPWAGVPKGFTSAWSLSIRDAAGAELANVPLDLSKFDLDPAHKGQPLRVQGCIVKDSHVAMLANVPCFASAASYVFLRDKTVIGTVEGAAVRQLAGGGR
jgi:hypothetical protein